MSILSYNGGAVVSSKKRNTRQARERSGLKTHVSKGGDDWRRMCSSLLRSPIWSGAANHRYRLSQGTIGQPKKKPKIILLFSRCLRWTPTCGWACLALPQTSRRWFFNSGFCWPNHFASYVFTIFIISGETEDRVPYEHVRAEREQTDEAQNLCQYGLLLNTSH